MVTSSQTVWPQTAPVFFSGGENPVLGRYWVDDFKMWATPLTAAQIQANYIDGIMLIKSKSFYERMNFKWLSL